MNSEIKKNKIICIGNRLIPEDAFAMDVYDLLAVQNPLSGIEIIEGGIGGLNLLGHLENGGNIVFVDTISGFSQNKIVVLNQQEIIDSLETEDFHYGHDSGIAYLLSVLPLVCDTPLPDAVFLVGFEVQQFTRECQSMDKIIEKAAAMSLEIALNGYFEEKGYVLT